MNLSENITLDWISFTLPYSAASMDRAIKLGDGYDMEMLDFGRFRYNRGIRILDGGNIYFNPEKKEMGIHVAINARSLALMDVRPLQLINQVLHWDGKFKRVDIAFDDYDGLLDPDEMYRKILAGEVVTRYRRVTRISGANLSSGEKTGDTINVGRRSSESFVRIYDKAREMEAKKIELPAGVKTWIRVELEMKGEKAHTVAELIGNTALSSTWTAATVLSELLFGLLDFKDNVTGDTNKSRWPTSKFWLDFIRVSSKRRLSLPKKEKTLDGAKRWIQSQVASTLAMIILSYDYDSDQSGYDFVIECVKEGEEKMSLKQQKMLDDYSEEQKERHGVG